MTIVSALMNHYAVKLVVTWILVFSVLALRISHPLPIPRPAAFPLWMLDLLDLLATYGMTLPATSNVFLSALVR
jgi:hypothetical protein